MMRYWLLVIGWSIAGSIIIGTSQIIDKIVMTASSRNQAVSSIGEKCPPGAYVTVSGTTHVIFGPSINMTCEFVNGESDNTTEAVNDYI